MAPGIVGLAARPRYALPKLASLFFQQLHADGQVQGTQVQDGPHPHVPSPQAHAPGAQAHPAQQLFFSLFCSMIVSPFERVVRCLIVLTRQREKSYSLSCPSPNQRKKASESPGCPDWFDITLMPCRKPICRLRPARSEKQAHPSFLRSHRKRCGNAR